MPYQVDNDFHHRVLLFRPALCYKKRDGNERGIVNALVVHVVIEDAVLVHKPKEQCGGNAFVAVAKTVVLGNKVKEHDRLLFNCWIKLLTAKSLIYLTDAALETVVLLICEEVVAAELFTELFKDFHGSFISGMELFFRRTLRNSQSLVVIIVKTVKGVSVIDNDIKKCVADIGGEISL